MRRYLAVLAVFCLNSFVGANPDTHLAPSAIIQSFSQGQVAPDWRIYPPILSADGSKLAIHVSAFTLEPERTTIYDVQSGKKICDFDKPKNEASRHVLCFSADGARVAVITTHKTFTNTLQIIDLPNGHIAYEYTSQNGIECYLTPDGKRLLHGGIPSGKFAVVDLETGKILSELPTDQWEAPDGVFSSDSRLVVTENSNTWRLRVWNISTSKMVSALEMRDLDMRTSLRFIQGDTALRGVNREGVVQTWDVKTGRRLSRVEPQTPHVQPLDPNSPNETLSHDGKSIIRGRSGGIVFEDAETQKDTRTWRLPPDVNGIAYADTIRNQSVLVAAGDRGDGDVMLMRIPSVDALPKVDSSEQAKRAAVLRDSEIAPVGPAIAIPPHTPAELGSPAWWLARAEAECANVTDRHKRGEYAAQIMIGFAELSDEAGEQRMMRIAQDSFADGGPRARSPVAAFSDAVLPFHIRRLVRAGKIDDAIGLASDHPQLLAEVAKDVARKGDIPKAMEVFKRLPKDFQSRDMYSAVWLLLADGNVKAAETLAQQIDDAYTQAEAYSRVAVYKAQHRDADGAISDFAKIIGNPRAMAAHKIVAAFAQQKDDAGARRFIGVVPGNQQRQAWNTLIQGQFDRDDLDIAKQTAAQAEGNTAASFNEGLVEAEMRISRTREAISLITREQPNSSLAASGFDAAIKYGRLDAAAELLRMLPLNDGQNRGRRAAAVSPAARLALAFAGADRVTDAQKTLATITPSPRPDGRPDPNYLMVTWAIVAAQRRAGDTAIWKAARQPLLDAFKQAPGAPSREETLGMLFTFDVVTGDLEAAEADLADCDPQMLRGVDYFLMSELDPKGRIGGTAPTLEQSRGILRLICQSIDRPVIEMAMDPIVKAHVEKKKYAEWLAFAEKLPSPRARIAAYQLMAQALTPSDPPEPNE